MVQQCQWPHILGACSPSRNDGVDYKEVEDEVGPVGEGGANAVHVCGAKYGFLNHCIPISNPKRTVKHRDRDRWTAFV